MKRDFLPWTKPILYGQEKVYLVDALDSTWISGGQYVNKFEEEFTRYNGSHYGITTSNGTTALQLALLGMDIGPDDEVIVPGFTFVAPVNMVIGAGATPVYVDIDPFTWCINPDLIEKSITDKTKAIIVVHVYGNICEMDIIKKLAQKHGLSIIEDAAEATFSKYKGKYAGTFGDIGCFSFQATKTIAMGEGGLVMTDNEKLYNKMKIIRDHGMRQGKRYWHDMIGYNFRLTNLQAAVGCGQLENLKTVLSDRKRVYEKYIKCLADEPGITLQCFKPEVDPIVWAIAVKVDLNIFSGDRDFLMKALNDVGIETRPGFYPLSDMPLYNAPLLPVSYNVGRNVISLPSFTSLTGEEIVFICDQLKKLRK